MGGLVGVVDMVPKGVVVRGAVVRGVGWVVDMVAVVREGVKEVEGMEARVEGMGYSSRMGVVVAAVVKEVVVVRVVEMVAVVREVVEKGLAEREVVEMVAVVRDPKVVVMVDLAVKEGVPGIVL